MMNVLVIVAVKTRREIQRMSNTILACLAGTDLVVGIATLPASIAAETFAIADGSVTTYCYIMNKMVSPLRFLSVLASVFHLLVISVDRYIALKYTYRYEEIETKFRIAIAVVFAWFLAGVYTIFRVLIVSSLPSFVLQYIMILNLLIIVHCHISVYFTFMDVLSLEYDFQVFKTRTHDHNYKKQWIKKKNHTFPPSFYQELNKIYFFQLKEQYCRIHQFLRVIGYP